MIKTKLGSILSFIFIACILPCTHGVTEEHINVVTLRNQANHLWKEQYTDNYGRIVNVDVVPLIDDVKEVPILIMDSPAISKENVYNAFPPESIDVMSNNQSIDFSCIDKESGATVSIHIAGPENLAYPTPECRDIIINYTFPKTQISSSSPTLTIHDGFFSLPNEINLDTSYLGKNGLTVRESLELTEKRLSAFFPDYELQFSLFWFGLVKAPNPYYSCIIRQLTHGIPILMSSKDPVLNTSEQELGIKPLDEWKLSYKLQYGSFQKSIWTVKISPTKFSIVCRPLKVKSVLLNDVPLCNMDRIIQTIEDRIHKGYIRNVYSLRFGYCCYFDKNEEIILCPVWEVECDYMFNPKEEMADYKENTENPITSRLYYRTMIVNAQTGEFMDPLELKEKLLYCPEIITWEDVQS